MTTGKRPAKGKVIKLNLMGDGTYGRDSWFSYGPFKAKVNDDKSLTIGLPDAEPQVCPVSTNEHGDYYKVNMLGGIAFATVYDSEQYGKYVRLKLGDKVVLPEAVQAKIAYKPKGQGQSGGARKTQNTDFWS